MDGDGRLITAEVVRAAFADVPASREGARQRMTPVPRGPAPGEMQTPPKEAGVLVLIAPRHDAAGLHIVLTRRTEYLRGHSGQISFPGGRCEPEDSDTTMTALRETCEELALCQSELEVIGRLEPVYIPPSHYLVYPTVALADEAPVLRPNPDEVAEVFTLALESLLDPAIKASEIREIQGYQVRIPYYRVLGHKVWGATAILLSELEDRLRAASPA
jgi:8-oxo-dGTP pyrophosphatase MutT (NUDIX family)